MSESIKKTAPTDEEVTISDLLERQMKPRALVTLQQVDSDESMVKVTPWTPGAHGCQCSRAVNLTRKAIRRIQPTGQQLFCCGQTLEVVRVEFEPEITIPASYLLDQFQTPIREPLPGSPLDEYCRRNPRDPLCHRVMGSPIQSEACHSQVRFLNDNYGEIINRFNAVLRNLGVERAVGEPLFVYQFKVTTGPKLQDMLKRSPAGHAPCMCCEDWFM